MKIAKSIAAVSLLVATTLASCGGASTTDKGSKADEAPAPAAEVKSGVKTYLGTLPSADTEGIKYKVTFTGDDKAGTYEMTQDYLTGKPENVFNTKGKYDREAGTQADGNRYYVILISDSTPADTTYFVETSDSTITLVNSNLEMAANPADYSLTLEK